MRRTGSVECSGCGAEFGCHMERDEDGQPHAEFYGGSPFQDCSVKGCRAETCTECRILCESCGKILCDQHATKKDGESLCPECAAICRECEKQPCACAAQDTGSQHDRSMLAGRNPAAGEEAASAGASAASVQPDNAHGVDAGSSPADSTNRSQRMGALLQQFREARGLAQGTPHEGAGKSGAVKGTGMEEGRYGRGARSTETYGATVGAVNVAPRNMEANSSVRRGAVAVADLEADRTTSEVNCTPEAASAPPHQNDEVQKGVGASEINSQNESTEHPGVTAVGGAGL